MRVSASASPTLPSSKLTHSILIRLAPFSLGTGAALDAFDGTRILINKQLSPQMLVGHNFFLGSTAFGPGKNTHFQFNAQVNASETLSVIGSLDIGGTAEGRIFKIVDNVTTKLHCACNPSQPEGDMMTLEAEYAGQTFNCTGKYGLAYGGSLAALSWCQVSGVWAAK